MLTGLSALGTAAMLWVGGGIIVHGLEVLHIFEPVPHAIHAIAEAAAANAGVFSSAVEWIVGAIGAAIVGFFVGGVIVMVVRQFSAHPEKLITD
jgi:predicted DNA repair protein MutK